MKKTSLYILILTAVVACVFAGKSFWHLKVQNLTSRDGEAHCIYVYPHTTCEQLLTELQAHYRFASQFHFRLHCRLMHFSEPKTGCYLLGSALCDLDVIRRFRNQEQTPVQVTFNNIRTAPQLAQRLASQLMLDSLDIITRLESDSCMQHYGLNAATAVTLFIPDTYELYWNISPDALFERMQKEYRHFWNGTRLEKAKALSLTPAQVATIASIIEEESNRQAEYPVIAGLYINRLKKNMPLQACPTVKFALQDFGLRRILEKHLQVDSPYNTYKYAGLPPGPIRIPRASTMDAVLNRQQHNYLYMCANADFSGTHHFSATYAEHARYARHYQAELNKRKIK